MKDNLILFIENDYFDFVTNVRLDSKDKHAIYFTSNEGMKIKATDGTYSDEYTIYTKEPASDEWIFLEYIEHDDLI